MKTTFFLLLLCSSITQAQDTSRHRGNFIFTGAVQQYFDRGHVMNDGKLPDNIIFPANTNGYNVGILYQRVSPRNIIWNAGVQFGTRKYDIGIRYDLSNFDPEASNTLMGQVYTNRIKASVNYVGPRLMAGYRWPINRQWALSAMAGGTVKIFVNKKRESSITKSIIYRTDDGAILKEEVLIQEDYLFGRGELNYHNVFRARYFNRSIVLPEIYIGLDRSYNGQFFKSVSFGAEVNRSYWRNGGDCAWVWARGNVNVFETKDMSRDVFYDKNISIALRVGLGLW